MNRDKVLDILRVPKKHRNFVPEAVAGSNHWEKSIKPYIGTLPERLRQGHGMVFLGNYSAGKSCCAAHVLECALAFHKVGCWIRMDEIAEINIRDSVFDTISGKPLSEHILECPLLVIDEFFIRGGDLRYQEHATEILIRRRVDDMKSTIITTNVAAEEIASKFESLYAALEEQFKFVKFDKYDYRKDRLGRLK